MSMDNDVPYVEIYTDGACSGNPGPGGWGALLIFKDHNKEIMGGEVETTNNRMEISAAIEAIRTLKKQCKVKIYTDSKYLKDGITKWIHNWQKKNWRKSDNTPVKNVDLWKNLQHEIEKHDIIWEWVKGHSDNEGNIAADRLATTAANKYKNRD